MDPRLKARHKRRCLRGQYAHFEHILNPIYKARTLV